MDIQVAKCDGGKFDPDLGYREDGPECPADGLELPTELDTEYKKKLHAHVHGWVRRTFKGPKPGDKLREWSFCPDHVKTAVEQYYLAQFSDDSE